MNVNPGGDELGWYLSRDNKQALVLQATAEAEAPVHFSFDGDGPYWVTSDDRRGELDDGIEYAVVDISAKVKRATQILRSGHPVPLLDKTYGLYNEQNVLASLHRWHRNPQRLFPVMYTPFRLVDDELGIPLKNNLPDLGTWWQLHSEGRIKDVTEHIGHRVSSLRGGAKELFVPACNRRWTGVPWALEFVSC